MQRENRRKWVRGAWIAVGLVGSWLAAPALVETSSAEEATAPPHCPSSTFDAAAEGWTSSDGDHALSAADGYLRVSDITEDWCWITAPDDFVGNWSSFAQISLAVRGDDRATPQHPIVLELTSPAASATYEVHRRFVAPGEWRTITVPLRAAMWNVSGDWDTLLNNVRSLRLRLDLHDGTDATEVHDLDDVQLVPRERARSTFDTGVDGWTVEGGVLQGGGGHLLVVDQTAGWCWIRAPKPFLGDWTRVSTIEFEVRADDEREVVQPLRIQVESPHGMARVQLPLDAVTGGRWRTVQVRLDPADWAVSGDWSRIMATVQDLWIRLDLTAAHAGEETTSLRGVRLVTGSLDPTSRVGGGR